MQIPEPHTRLNESEYLGEGLRNWHFKLFPRLFLGTLIF